MTGLQIFWAFVHALMVYVPGCIDLTVSTHSHVVYGGNCVQAWLYALGDPGIAWTHLVP